MQINRKIDLSVYYYLQSILPSVVTVLDGFPTGPSGKLSTNLTLPTVAVERQPISVRPFELGGKGLEHYFYVVDVYAQTKAQRDELAYIIQNKLNEENIPIYDYDAGFPPVVAPQLGSLVMEGDIENRNVYVFPDVSPEKLYWRSVIDFVGYFSPI
jgi:hypothetical protein